MWALGTVSRTASASSRGSTLEVEPSLPAICVHEELYRLPAFCSVSNLTRPRRIRMKLQRVQGSSEAYGTMFGHEWELLRTPRIPAIPGSESAGRDGSGAGCAGHIERTGFRASGAQDAAAGALGLHVVGRGWRFDRAHES